MKFVIDLWYQLTTIINEWNALFIDTITIILESIIIQEWTMNSAHFLKSSNVIESEIGHAIFSECIMIMNLAKAWHINELSEYTLKTYKKK